MFSILLMWLGFIKENPTQIYKELGGGFYELYMLDEDDYEYPLLEISPDTAEILKNAKLEVFYRKKSFKEVLIHAWFNPINPFFSRKILDSSKID